MLEYFAFIDESTARRYRLCLVAIPTEKLAETRKSMQTLRLKGQKRIHMSKENDSRKRQILDHVLRMPDWDCLVLEVRTNNLSAKHAREKLFLVAANHKLWSRVKHFVIEDSTQRQTDRAVFSWILRNSDHEFSFEICSASGEECLWLADVLGWAYARGGVWRKEIKTRIQVLSGP